jgi:transcriptional regulator with XRE-family HTH domain
MSATTGPTQPSVWARRLKDARLAAGLSQRQLGIDAGLDESVASARINRYELGIHRPDYGIALHLARVLGVPVAYLYCDDEILAQTLLAMHRAPLALRQRVLRLLQEATR